MVLTLHRGFFWEIRAPRMEGIDGLRPVGCTRAWNPGVVVSQEDEEATPAYPALALREFWQEQTSMSPNAPSALVVADLTGGSSDQTPCPVPWRRIFASRRKPRPLQARQPPSISRRASANAAESLPPSPFHTPLRPGAEPNDTKPPPRRRGHRRELDYANALPSREYQKACES